MSLFEPFFDAEDLSACVSAETRVGDLNRIAREHGIYFPLWLDPRQTFAELYLGPRVCSRSFRFGLVGDNVLGLRFRLKNGRTVDLGGRVVKNVTGFDLTRFFAGSEGAFGRPETLILRLRPLALLQKTLNLSGTPQALERFRAALASSAWVHAVDSFDFESVNGFMRLALSWSCTPDESPVFERAFRRMAQDEACLPSWGEPLAHMAKPFFQRQVPLSQTLKEAALLQQRHGGRISGFLGHGLMQIRPDFGIPARETSQTYPDLEKECVRLLETLT